MNKFRKIIIPVFTLVLALLVLVTPEKAYAGLGGSSGNVTLNPSLYFQLGYTSNTLGEELTAKGYDYSSLTDYINVYCVGNWRLNFNLYFDKTASPSTVSVLGDEITVNYPCVYLPESDNYYVICLINGKAVFCGNHSGNNNFIYSNIYGFNDTGNSAWSNGSGSLFYSVSNGDVNSAVYYYETNKDRSSIVLRTSVPVFNDLTVAKSYAVTGTVSDEDALIAGGSFVPTPTPTPTPTPGTTPQYDLGDFGISAGDVASSGDLFSWIKNIFEKISFHMFDGRSIVGDEWFADGSDASNPMDTYTPAEDSFFSRFYEIIAGNEDGEGFGSFISGCMYCIGVTTNVTANGNSITTFDGISLLYFVAFGLLIGVGVFSRLL